MERNWQTEEARVEKQKPDYAQKRFTVFEIDLSSWRNERREDLRIDCEIEHGEISPIRGEQRSHGETIRRSSVFAKATAR